MRPHQLAGGRIHRHHRATRPGRGVHNTVRHQRRRLQIEFGTRPKVVCFEAPCHLELIEIVGVDLVERRIVRVAEISSVRPPLSVLGSGLPRDGHSRPQEQAGCQGCPHDIPRKHLHVFLLTVSASTLNAG